MPVGSCSVLLLPFTLGLHSSCSQEGETPRLSSLGWIWKGIWISKIDSHVTGWKLRLIDPQHIFEMQDDSVKPGDNVIVMDDVIATGKFTSGSWEYMFWIVNPRWVSQTCRWVLGTHVPQWISHWYVCFDPLPLHAILPVCALWSTPTACHPSLGWFSPMVRSRPSWARFMFARFRKCNVFHFMTYLHMKSSSPLSSPPCPSSPCCKPSFPLPPFVVHVLNMFSLFFYCTLCPINNS